MLSDSKLPTSLLAQIWVLSSTPGSKTLGVEEFLTCMFLVSAATSSVPIPDSLPKELSKSIRKYMEEASSGAPTGQPMVQSSSKSNIRTNRSGSKESPSDKSSKSKSGPRTSTGPDSAPSSGKRSKKWTLLKEEKRRFLEVFAANAQDGFVNGDIAVRVFGQSGLPRTDLASIWALSDMDRDQKLSQQEFCIAMHLITRRLQGVDLPATVPSSLVISAASDPTSKKSKGLNRAGQSSNATRASPVTGGPSQRSSVVISSVPATDVQSSGDPSRPALQRSASSADHHAAVDISGPVRNPIATRTMSGFSGVGSYSTSELPDSVTGSQSGIFSHSSSSLLSTSRASPPATVAAYGVDDRIIPEYDSNVDLSKLESVTDLPTVRLLMSQLSEEVKSLGTALDKSQLQHESLNEKLASRMDQNAMSQRRRANFETILRNYNQQLEADISLYDSLKTELNEISHEIDQQQQQLNAPQYDLVQLRERRKLVHSEYARVKAESNASHEEHTRLVLEVEKLKLAGAEQASNIDINWSDHGFKEEPAVAFGDGDFVSSSSSSSLAAPSASTFAPTFSFQAGGIGTGSGTMTPTYDDFDFNDGASEAGDDVDLGWLKPDATATNNTAAAATGNADFFVSESANWADFSMQEDARQRERAATVSKTAKRPSSRKSKDGSSPSTKSAEKEKTGKKKKH